jgi:hypothetical protein
VDSDSSSSVELTNEVGVNVFLYYTLLFNPFGAMCTIWHHIIVGFKVMAQKRFIKTWICWVKCSSKRFTVAKSVF